MKNRNYAERWIESQHNLTVSRMNWNVERGVFLEGGVSLKILKKCWVWRGGILRWVVSLVNTPDIKPFWISFRADFEANFQIICNFLTLSTPLRVVWPKLLHWRIPLMSRNVFNTHNKCLRWFLAALQLFKVKYIAKKCENYLKIYLKTGSKWDSERFDILLFFAFFFVRPLTLNSFRVAKNHPRHMLWVW